MASKVACFCDEVKIVNRTVIALISKAIANDPSDGHEKAAEVAPGGCYLPVNLSFCRP